MRIKESWLLADAVCLPRDGGEGFTLSPPIPFTLTTSFIILDQVYTGELEVTGDYPTTVDPDTISTIATLRNLGVSYVAGLQDISVSFKNEGAPLVAPHRDTTPITPFLRLVRTDVISASSTLLQPLTTVTSPELFPLNKPWYPVSWQDDTLSLITPGNEGLLAGFIRYPVDGKSRLVTSGLLPFNVPLINDDYFLDLTMPHYISLFPPPTSSVVAIGKGVDQYTIELNIEVKVWR